MKEKAKLQDRYYGCLLGGAIGDTLGRKNQISVPITTIRTMLTADGLLQAESRFIASSEDYLDHIASDYTYWYSQRLGPRREAYRSSERISSGSWLQHVLTSYNCPATDRACTLEVAPLGLYFDDPWRAAQLATRVSALTEKQPFISLPAAFIAYIIAAMVEKPQLTLVTLIRRALGALAELYAKEPALEAFLKLMVQAVKLGQRDVTAPKALAELATTSLAQNILAEAVYCCVKYQHSFREAVTAAADYSEIATTGAVTGNILGAYLGLSQIPQEYLARLELKQELMILAEDLFKGNPYPKDEAEVSLWKSKYLEYTFLGA